MSKSVSRRSFVGNTLAAGAAIGLSTKAYGRILGANERVTMGVIGCGGRGSFVLQRLQQRGAEIALLCDPDQNQIGKAQKLLPGEVPTEKDFRKVVERKELDAVLIATPDHWHALPFIHAVQAGKDVYMEKPTAYTVAESRAMIEAAKKTKCIVQIGTQQKSGEHYRKAVEQIQKGDLGTISHVRFWNVFNHTKQTGGTARTGAIGSPPDCDPPAGVDYDWWLGPAPQRAFNPNRFHWNYAYFWDYSGGMMSGWGVHHVDIIHWAMGEDAPQSVTATGGTFAVKDNRETPDTLDALFRYKNFTLHGSIYHGCERLIEGRVFGIAFHGTKGTLVIDRGGYEIWPEGAKEPNKFGGSSQDNAHAQNFLDAVKSRKKPFADLETGHKSSIPCLLANIAFRTGRKLEWDAANEKFVNDPAADKYLSREYRKPWALPA